MNEDDKNKELIERIAETLRNHTEPYKEGAWERFATRSANQRKKRVMVWVSWGAAAMVFFAAGLFLFNSQQSDLPVAEWAPESTQIISSEPRPLTEREDEPVAPHQPDLVTTTEQSSPAAENVVSLTANISSADHEAAMDTVQLVSVPVAPDESKERTGDGSDTTTEEQLQPINLEHPLSQEQQLLARESAWGAEDSREEKIKFGDGETGKWDLGVVVAPSMTSERLNMGGGVAVAYRLSDKFSIASGVSLSDLGLAQQQPGGPQRQMSSLAPNSPAPGQEPDNTPYQYREITSVTSTLLAIDIPLNLRYHVTKGFYTSVGVSFLGILNERRINHFVDHINLPTDSPNNLKAIHAAERSRDQPLEGKGYAGFANFSVGRSIPLSTKLTLSVEPYFKLPIGRLSREDMDFTNGGIRIVTGF